MGEIEKIQSDFFLFKRNKYYWKITRVKYVLLIYLFRVNKQWWSMFVSTQVHETITLLNLNNI